MVGFKENGEYALFQTGTIRRVLGVPPKTSTNRDVGEELTGMYLQRVLGGTPNILRIPNEFMRILPDQCQLNAATRVPPTWDTLQARPWVARSPTSCRLTVPGGRYPYPGLSMWILLNRSAFPVL